MKGLFFPISLSDFNFNPQNIKYIPAVKIKIFLELEKNSQFITENLEKILRKKYD